jgi:riboflavin kinase/FMN adenylyltransferase
MRQFDSLSGLRIARDRCLLAVGAFDGVHVGHRTILREMVLVARAQGLQSAVLTFEPHPLEVLAPAEAPPRLTGPAARAELMAAAGIDYLVTMPFDRDVAAMPPEQFIHEHFGGAFRPRGVWIGYNFGFGSRGRGGPALLRQLGQELGFAVRVFDPLTSPDGVVVSSTAVREALAAGQLALAARLLGRPYRLWGEVVAGDQRGRTIGFPTANVQAADRLAVPGRGVYAGWVVAPGHGVWPSVINSGWRPTFAGEPGPERLEAHLIGFDASIYGRRVEIIFVDRLRDERRFADAARLATQIAADSREALALLRPQLMRPEPSPQAEL